MSGNNKGGLALISLQAVLIAMGSLFLSFSTPYIFLGWATGYQHVGFNSLFSFFLGIFFIPFYAGILYVAVVRYNIKEGIFAPPKKVKKSIDWNRVHNSIRFWSKVAKKYDEKKRQSQKSTTKSKSSSTGTTETTSTTDIDPPTFDDTQKNSYRGIEDKETRENIKKWRSLEKESE